MEGNGENILADLDKKLTDSQVTPQPIRERMHDAEIQTKLDEAAGAEAFLVGVWQIKPVDGKLQIHLFTKASRSFPVEDLSEAAAMLYRDFDKRVKARKDQIREIEPPAGIQEED